MFLCDLSVTIDNFVGFLSCLFNSCLWQNDHLKTYLRVRKLVNGSGRRGEHLGNVVLCGREQFHSGIWRVHRDKTRRKSIFSMNALPNQHYRNH
jgi:hypothetical protein